MLCRFCQQWQHDLPCRTSPRSAAKPPPFDSAIKVEMMRPRSIVWGAFLLFASASPAQDVLTKVKRSEPKLPGPGREYSPWYVLESDPAPLGYSVSDTQFKLEGSNSCGANAQCLEGERTPSQSTWLFRLQGLGQQPIREATSVAVLTTKYRRVDAQATYTLTVSTKEKSSSRGGYFGCFEPGSEIPASDGPWCFLSAGRPKPGYRIRSASFSLQGDRMCLGNDFDPEPDDPAAWCRRVARTDNEVIWQFKMLGHSETGTEIAGLSFGKLVVVYEKVP